MKIVTRDVIFDAIAMGAGFGSGLLFWESHSILIAPSILIIAIVIVIAKSITEALLERKGKA